MIEPGRSWHDVDMHRHAVIPALGNLLLATPLILTGCNGDPSGESGGESGTETETGSETGETGEPEPDEEIPGQPLEHARWCPDIVSPPLQRFAAAEFLSLGPCGDMLVRAPGDELLLVRVDGETQELGASSEWGAWFSPRGRLLARLEAETHSLYVYNLETGATINQALSQTTVTDFVVSKFSPGTRQWYCGQDGLRVKVEQLVVVNVGENANCETVAASGMHSLLVFATLDGEVMLADTDALTVEPTNLMDFQFSDRLVLGRRRDTLALSTSGAYIIHTIRTVQDNDGSLEPLPTGVRLFDAEHGVELASIDDDELPRRQAAVYGAPLLFLDGGALMVAFDGQTRQLTAETNYWQFQPRANGSVHAIDGGAVVRSVGPDYASTEVVLPSDPANVVLELSASGSFGSAGGETDICATPACASNLHVLRRFGPDGALPEWLGSSPWRVAQVFDDGTMLTLGAPVEGPFDSDVELPTARLLMFAADGSVLDEWPADGAHNVSSVALADGRVVVALSSYEVVDELVVADAEAGTITAYPDYDAHTRGAGELYIDALGKRIAMAYHAGVDNNGVAWGELPVP